MAHIAAVSFARLANIQVSHVTYKGSAQLITDVLGGQIEVGFPGFVPQTEQAKVLAVTGSERLKNLPNAPTLKESGYDIVAGTWFGIIGPAKMPAEAVEKINKLVNEFVESKEGQQLFLTLGMQPIRGTPQDMKAFMAAEVARWEPVVRAGNITVD
jgi:tripartite-type tricarboxylate transporter receptor subunit TctC